MSTDTISFSTTTDVEVNFTLEELANVLTVDQLNKISEIVNYPGAPEPSEEPAVKEIAREIDDMWPWQVEDLNRELERYKVVKK